MCAIVDANGAGEIFGKDQSEAGKKFFQWLAKGQGHLVIGGEITRELDKTPAKLPIRELLLSGRATSSDDALVDKVADRIRSSCRSNDAHVIALAQVSGARLLYSNDIRLHQDFGDSTLVNRSKGSVYSTYLSQRYSKHHKRLLSRTDLCRAAG